MQLPAAGFTFDTGQIFWLISMPSLVGATLRFPYTFLVPKVGGRNWTIISAALLLIPAIALGFAVGNPDTPFGVMLFVAALAGFGGGNFASSMSNITFFYPARRRRAGPSASTPPAATSVPRSRSSSFRSPSHSVPSAPAARSTCRWPAGSGSRSS